MSQNNQTNHQMQPVNLLKSEMEDETKRPVLESSKQSIDTTSNFISNMEEIVGERLLDDW